MTSEPNSRHPSPPPVVVLHERSGGWARQLRSRLGAGPARWVETRSTAELLDAVAGGASPVVLIEAGRDPEAALRDLAMVVARGSSPLTLFIDPIGRPEVVEMAREFGATHVGAGRFTPPEVAALIGRWIELSARAGAREGWSRPRPADPARNPSAWVDELVAEAARPPDC